MADIKISGTFLNDTSTKTLAYAEQIMDRAYDISNLQDPSKRQSEINAIVKKLKEDFDTLLGDEGKREGVIDTFNELKTFLAGIPEGEKTLQDTINNLLAPLKKYMDELNAKIFTDLAEVVQESGDAENKVMSQKAVSRLVSESLNGLKVVVLSETEYESVTRKDPNVLYLIPEES